MMQNVSEYNVTWQNWKEIHQDTNNDKSLFITYIQMYIVQREFGYFSPMSYIHTEHKGYPLHGYLNNN